MAMDPVGGELEEEPSDSGEPGQTSELSYRKNLMRSRAPLPSKMIYSDAKCIHYVYTDHINWYLNDKCNDTKSTVPESYLAMDGEWHRKDDEDKPIKAVDFSGKRITLQMIST